MCFPPVLTGHSIAYYAFRQSFCTIGGVKILAIETSCDETACAVVEDGTKVLSNVVASSAAIHEKYGGIVPEMAAREQLRSMIPVINEALLPLDRNYKSIDSFTVAGKTTEKDRILPMHPIIKNHIDAIAVTVGPGLIGSLLVGVETAKTIAFVTGKPIIPVNHVVAHVYANFVRNEQQTTHNKQQKNNGTMKQRSNKPIEFPAISLVVSGGHTELYLMESMKQLKWLGGTLDDAAGEAFDKTARLLGFGAQGGQAIERAALKFRVKSSRLRRQAAFRVILPRPMMKDESLNFSFSGLKTAVVREWTKYPHPTDEVTSAFAHEIQEAITDVLVNKTLRASRQHNATSILLSGGVAANMRLREKFYSTVQPSNHPAIYCPPPALCTDNAVSIASCAYYLGKPKDWRKIEAEPDLSVEKNFS